MNNNTRINSCVSHATVNLLLPTPVFMWRQFICHGDIGEKGFGVFGLFFLFCFYFAKWFWECWRVKLFSSPEVNICWNRPRKWKPMFSTCCNTFLLFISSHLDTLLVVRQQCQTELCLPLRNHCHSGFFSANEKLDFSHLLQLLINLVPNDGNTMAQKRIFSWSFMGDCQRVSF